MRCMICLPDGKGVIFSDYYNVFGAPRQIFFPFYIDLCRKVWYK